MPGSRQSFWRQAHIAAALPWAALMRESRPFASFEDFAGSALDAYVMAALAGAAAIAALASLRDFWSRWHCGPIPPPEAFDGATSAPAAAAAPRRGARNAAGR